MKEKKSKCEKGDFKDYFCIDEYFFTSKIKFDNYFKSKTSLKLVCKNGYFRKTWVYNNNMMKQMYNNKMMMKQMYNNNNNNNNGKFCVSCLLVKTELYTHTVILSYQ